MMVSGLLQTGDHARAHAADVEAVPLHAAGRASRDQRAHRTRRAFHADGVHQIQTGGLPGEPNLLPIPGASGGNRRLPAHPGDAGRDRPG
ncbi:MAG: hypothetical protein ACRDTC_16385 [Pseudonocardiaceae bacterium]